MLFQVFAERYERQSLLVPSNLPFAECVQVFQGEQGERMKLDVLGLAP